ncbi:uncharacterized protein B0H18DRAFT_1119525 [Fomitopsis serialis]|uniref:uncharacterized protein n=1 Tax=Fomitopsis serialis TaxID=139415 RepID=UPI0020088F23|nr:uncharacterized protein B0H18DRAFT_1119525 [Neoantrodia serialis]KAH9925334.1 hypothetical protein B0H18DRAFT_1119525 [Neoantrodia serialis]
MLSLRRGYSRIPVELLDIIMDYTDKKTQGSCSLLLCEPASTVLPYIRELHLEEGLKLSVEEQARSDTNESAFLAHARPQERQPWLEAVLPKIRVDGLTALRSLRLKNLDWEQLSARSRSSLVNLCQRLDALELVSFGGTCVPYSTLAELLIPFCTEHAFSGMTSLRSLHLEMYDLRYIPAILRQLESRELVDVTVRATVQASDKGTLEALARCLSTGPLASARPRVSFICAAERNTRFSAPIMEGMRDALLTHLTDLRKEGRLRILRPTLDPMTRKEIGEEEF